MQGRSLHRIVGLILESDCIWSVQILVDYIPKCSLSRKIKCLSYTDIATVTTQI